MTHKDIFVLSFASGDYFQNSGKGFPGGRRGNRFRRARRRNWSLRDPLEKWLCLGFALLGTFLFKQASALARGGLITRSQWLYLARCSARLHGMASDLLRRGRW